MEQEDRDMLIRIDEKVISIEESFSKTPYQTLVEKVKINTWVIRLTIVALFTAMIKSVWKG